MKHLDAPWRAVEDRSDLLFSHTIHSQNDRVARVLQPSSSFMKDPNLLRMKESARAQLLAAAPELLDKLKVCNLFLERERRKIDRVIDEVNELIARVEGDFAGDDFEAPPLTVKPEAILSRIAFLEAMKNEDK